MNKMRLLSGLLAVSLAIAAAPGVMAETHDLDAEDVAAAEAFDPATVPEWNQDEALILYGQLQERLVAMGVTEEDMAAAIQFLDGEFLSQQGDDPDDDEFGQAEEDEPELGDDEAGD